MKKAVPFRFVGHYNSFPIMYRAYPTFIEISCNGKSWNFRSYDEAMTFLRSMQKRKVRERKQHDFKR